MHATRFSLPQLFMSAASVALSLVALTPANASPIVFNNGLENNVSAASDQMIINSDTAVNLLVGGSITTTDTQDWGASVYDTSTFRLQGGSISTAGIQAFGIRAYHSSSVEVSSGSITTTNAQAFGIDLSDNSTLNLSGGSISTSGVQGFAIRVRENATANITGGIINTTGTQGFVINNSATTNISGGSFTGTGSSGYEIRNTDTGVVNIYGSSFDLGFGTISGSYFGVISGTLLDGSTFSAETLNSGTINLLASVPEPSTIILLTLGIATLRLRQKRSL